MFAVLCVRTCNALCFEQNMLNKSLVADYPRFGYRSLMIDTVRHYLPLPVLQDIIVSLLLWQPAFNIFVIHVHMYMYMHICVFNRW